MILHINTISEGMHTVLKQLMKIDELKSFRLVGGTALALQFGHRISVDLDLFAAGRINIAGLADVIKNYFGNQASIIKVLQHGIGCIIQGVKVDLYDWKVSYAHEPFVVDDIRIANAQDIFANKCEAILGRRAEKDFCDIGEIFKHYELHDLIGTLKIRYPFITPGAVFAILIKPETIQRDDSIIFLKEDRFEEYSKIIAEKMTSYQQSIIQKKEQESEARINKIKSLLEKKKNKG